MEKINFNNFNTMLKNCSGYITKDNIRVEKQDFKGQSFIKALAFDLYNNNVEKIMY